MISAKVNLSLGNLKKLFPAIVAGFQKAIPKALIAAVIQEIKQGKSPVEGQGRLVEYSPSYKDAIGYKLGRQFGKRERPVNLSLSGKMLLSVNVRERKSGVTIGFSDKKAEYHDELGAGKSKTLRRMLPTRTGETFSRTIMSKIIKVLRTEIIRPAIDYTGNKK